jgi:hypothetical protein
VLRGRFLRLGLTLVPRGGGAMSVRASGTVSAVDAAIAKNSGVEVRFYGGSGANGDQCGDIGGDSGAQGSNGL